MLGCPCSIICTKRMVKLHSPTCAPTYRNCDSTPTGSAAAPAGSSAIASAACPLLVRALGFAGGNFTATKISASTISALPMIR